MPLPAAVIVAGAVIAQASGVVTPAVNLITGIDKTITAVIDLRGYVPQVENFLHPVKPPMVRVKRTARKKP